MTHPSAEIETGPLPIVRRDDISPSEFHAAVWGRIFNAIHDPTRLPRAITTPTHTSHVQAALRLAAEENCSVSIRSGGHSWAAWSVRDDAILLDLVNLHGGEIEYDDASGVVSCGPAVTGRVLNALLGEKGRFFAGGHCPDVGLGGFLLQGGMGWNCKNWGWACESVKAVDVVTAGGEVKRCSEEENEDLFWAARGAGPGFPAIVTKWHLQTRAIEGVYQSLYIYPASEFRRVLQWVIDASKASDQDMEIVCVAIYPPDSPSVHILANFLVFKPSHSQAMNALEAIHSSRPSGAVMETFAEESSLPLQYCAQDKANPPGWRYNSDNAYIANDADVAAILEPAFVHLPTRESFALYFAMYPTSRRPLPSMALSMQSDHYFALYGVWKSPQDDSRMRTWLQDTMEKVEKHSVGSYLGDADFQVRGSRFWGQEEGKRLKEVRTKWDPEGRICGFLDEGRGVRNEHDWVEG
ncbi:Fc.00g113240.m01.CDS01 [Cosmosporella sp. VM-42]